MSANHMHACTQANASYADVETEPVDLEAYIAMNKQFYLDWQQRMQARRKDEL